MATRKRNQPTSKDNVEEQNELKAGLESAIANAIDECNFKLPENFTVDLISKVLIAKFSQLIFTGLNTSGQQLEAKKFSGAAPVNSDENLISFIKGKVVKSAQITPLNPITPTFKISIIVDNMIIETSVSPVRIPKEIPVGTTNLSNLEMISSFGVMGVYIYQVKQDNAAKKQATRTLTAVNSILKAT